MDTLRAAAIVAVMLYHLTIWGELSDQIFSVTTYGWMGVDLFFVLSGFLIGQQLLKPYVRGERPSILAFYKRRAYRILPAYLAVLALYVFVPAWPEDRRLSPLWKFLTFTMNFGLERRGFSHAWSLCVEEHFYLLLPLLVALLMRRSSVQKVIVVLVSFVVFGIGLRAWLLAHYPGDFWTRIYYPSYTRLDGLVDGVALAAVRTFRPVWWNALMERGHTLLLSGALCVAGVVWMFGGDNMGSDTGPAKWGAIVGFPLLGFGLALITASSMSRNGLLARWKVPGTGLLATLAFSLYLTHKAVAHLVMQRFPKVAAAQGPVSWLLYAVACFSAAILLHIAVERPFLRWRDRAARSESVTELEAEMRREPAL